MATGSDAGGIPEMFGKSADCGTIYPVQATDDGELRPVGTDGACSPGNDGFVSPAER